MAQANSKNSITASVDPTRRHFLTIAAGASVVSVGSLVAAAPADPIYEVIERHRKAVLAHTESVDIKCAFEEIGMQGEKLKEYKRLGALADAAYDAMEDVGLDLINTRPTTVAGILALCQYIAPLFGETEQPNLPQYIAYDDGTDAYTAEAFAYVIGRSIENMMKAEGTV
jgi:hypothetical protein